MGVYQFSANPYESQPIEMQVSRLANLAREYCKTIPDADFSTKDKVKELEQKRVNKLLSELGKR